jgi:hypothetical protein
LDGSRAGRRSRVPARGDAGEEYLGADGGVEQRLESSAWCVRPPRMGGGLWSSIVIK